MYSAYNLETGERTLARDSQKGINYVDSLINKQKVIPVQEEVKRYHFRYSPDVPEDKRLIDFQKNESETHESIKLLIYEKLLEYNEEIHAGVEWRYNFGRIADIGGYTSNGQAFAIEVVHNHTNYQDYFEKRRLYRLHDIIDVWIFTPEVFKFEQGYGKLLDILADCQNRYGKILFCENEEIKSLTMTRKHSDTYRAYDISPSKVGFNIDHLIHIEDNYRMKTVQLKYNQQMIVNENLKKDISLLEKENEKLISKLQSLEAIYDDVTIKELGDGPDFEFPLRKEVTCKYLGWITHPNYNKKVPFLNILVGSTRWYKKPLRTYHSNLKKVFGKAERGQEFKITRMNETEEKDDGYMTSIRYMIRRGGVDY